MPTSGLLQRFRRALRSIPRLRQPLAVGVVALLAATAASEAVAQQEVQPRWSNRFVLEPVPTGLKAMRMVYNATDNVLYWVDKDGLPTFAPRRTDAAARVDRASVELVGSMAERLRRADRHERSLLIREPVRVLLAPENPQLVRRMTARAQAVLAEEVTIVLPSAEFARQQPGDFGHRTPAEAARDSAERAEADRRARAERTLGHEMKQQMKQAGRDAVTGAVSQATYEATEAVLRALRRH